MKLHIEQFDTEPHRGDRLSVSFEEGEIDDSNMGHLDIPIDHFANLSREEKFIIAEKMFGSENVDHDGEEIVFHTGSTFNETGEHIVEFGDDGAYRVGFPEEVRRK